MRSTIAMVIQLVIFASAATSQSGIIQMSKWGEFGEKPGEFRFPTMIIADKHSDVYVVDQHNHRIQKFDSAGNFILMWGKFGQGQGEFNYPYGIAIDSGGNIYVSDMNNNRIQKFTSNGQFIAASGTYGSSDGQFKYPYGIAMGKDNILYVIDAFNYRIQKFTTELTFIDKWGSPEIFGIRLYMPHEIAVDPQGNIILSDRQNHRLAIFSKDGKLSGRFGEYGEGKNAKGGTFSEPHGIAVNQNGEMFICDRYNFSVQMIDSNRRPLMRWLTTGTFDDSKYFPLGITATATGTIYVTDHFAHNIQKYKLY